MKKIIISTIACLAMFAATAADYKNPMDAYKAKDIAWIVEHRTDVAGLYSKIVKAWPTDDIVALAIAYSTNGWYNMSHVLYYSILVNKEQAAIEAKKLLPNFTLPNGKYSFIYIVDDTSTYNQLMLQKFAQAVNADPTLASKLYNFIYLVNYLYSFNYKNPEHTISLNLTDDMVIASAKAYPTSTVLYDPVNRANSARLAKLQFNNSKFVVGNNQLLAFVNNADKKYHTNEYKIAAFNKITDCKVRSMIAVDINDPEKLLIALADIKQDTFNAAELEKIINLLNGQKSDWHATDVKKVLLDINSMYTTKLYDDRETWEPVLSKLRAMIEIR